MTVLDQSDLRISINVMTVVIINVISITMSVWEQNFMKMNASLNKVIICKNNEL